MRSSIPFSLDTVIGGLLGCGFNHTTVLLSLIVHFLAWTSESTFEESCSPSEVLPPCLWTWSRDRFFPLSEWVRRARDSSVMPFLLGQHLSVPNPQENKNKGNRLWTFLCGDQGGIPREQNRELTTTWVSIYTTMHEVNVRLACDAQLNLSQLN